MAPGNKTARKIKITSKIRSEKKSKRKSKRKIKTPGNGKGPRSTRECGPCFLSRLESISKSCKHGGVVLVEEIEELVGQGEDLGLVEARRVELGEGLVDLGLDVVGGQV